MSLEYLLVEILELHHDLLEIVPGHLVHDEPADLLAELLTGREIAGRLGIADKAASNEATIVQGLIADGFGALILMEEGRRYCANLARILDDAAKTRTASTPAFAAAPAEADVFTAVLRQRIVNHFNDCNVCDNCRTCNGKRRQLVGPYVPALIPIVFAGEFRDRIDEVIRRVVEQAHAGHNPSSHPGSSPPSAAAAGGVAVMAGRLMATAGAGPGAVTADAFVSRLQSLVHKASESNRLPRWLRRAIPRDAGPGASITVVAAFVAAVIVAVVVIVTVASALTSGGSATPQAGPGTGGVAAINTAGSGASQPSDCSNWQGNAALPVTTASLASSIQQVVTTCTGHAVSVTCTAPPEPWDYYTCTIPQQGVPAHFSDIAIDQTTGAWEIVGQGGFSS